MGLVVGASLALTGPVFASSQVLVTAPNFKVVGASKGSGVNDGGTATAALSIALDAGAGSLSGSAHATEGILGVQIASNAVASGSATARNTIAGYSQATWNDVLRFSLPEGSPVKILQIEGNLYLDGTLTAASWANVFGPVATRSAVDVRLSGTGVSTTRGSYSSSVLSGISDVPVATVIPFKLVVESNRVLPLSYTLTVNTSSTAYIPNGSEDQLATTSGAASFGSTLRWGGITSITEYRVGGTVNGVTVTSASGFDYMAAAVPEPQTYVLAMAGVLWVQLRARQKGRNLLGPRV